MNAALGLLPSPVRRRLQAWRRASTFDAFRSAGLVFIHVPRTGGTSVSASLFDIWINHFTIAEQLACFPADVAALPRFSVVRNPWDRAVSSWSFALAGTGKESGVFVQQPEIYKVPAFSSFERFVLEWLPAQRPVDLDPVFRPQCEYLQARDGTMPLHHIGRLENLTETLEWIAEQTGRPASIPHLNSTKHRHYREYYRSPEIRDAVAAYYANDVALLGYDC